MFCLQKLSAIVLLQIFFKIYIPAIGNNTQRMIQLDLGKMV